MSFVHLSIKVTKEEINIITIQWNQNKALDLIVDSEIIDNNIDICTAAD